MDIASLQLSVKSDGIQQANTALQELPRAASAAERAAQRWSMQTSAASRASQDFSRRVQVQIRNLEFERMQLTRNSAEQQRYAALRRAGVAEYSAEGRAISAAVRALQAQREASAAAAKSMQSTGLAATASSGAVGMLARSLGPLAAAFSAAAVAQRVWAAGMKAADMGEQAEQIGLTTDQLQAYRLVAAQSGVDNAALDASMMRLAKAMGAANDGGKEQIELFERLGVKILGANGELRKSSDIMPELARGLLGVSSETQRGAMMQELFGRSGMKMVTILTQLAQGNEALVDAAKRQGAVMSTDVINAWDKVGDSLVVAGQHLDTILATIAAPVATTALDQIITVLRLARAEIDLIQKGLAWLGSRAGKGVSVEDMQAEAAQVQGRIDQLSTQDRTTGRDALMQREYARLGVLQQGISEKMTAAYTPPVMDDIVVKGARNPTPKGSGSDPYAKAIEGGREYILTKQAEAAAVGLSTEAAARLKHEQELLNKVQGDGKVATDAQRAALSELAGAMAAADAGLEAAKYENERRSRVDDFLANQEMERQSIFLSTEAAARLRYETEMLAEAKRRVGEVSPEMQASISADAEAMARAEEQTRRISEQWQFAKDITKGIFTDLLQGVQQGQTLWESFGNAAMNALNKIADKLLSMAIDGLINSLFSGFGGGGMGGGGGGGGAAIGSMLGSLIGSLFADGAAFHHGKVVPFADGAAFHHGHLTRFAAGGIVTEPTYFDMAGNRRGVMGEAGPEAVMPLTRGPDGSLGVRAHGREAIVPLRRQPSQGRGAGGGSGGGDTYNYTVNVDQTVNVGEFVTTQQFASGLRGVKKAAEEGAMNGIVNRRKRGGLQDVFK